LRRQNFLKFKLLKKYNLLDTPQMWTKVTTQPSKMWLRTLKMTLHKKKLSRRLMRHQIKKRIKDKKNRMRSKTRMDLRIIAQQQRK